MSIATATVALKAAVADFGTAVYTSAKDLFSTMSASNIDLSKGTYFRKDVTAPITLTLTAPSANLDVDMFVLELKTTLAGSVTWFSGIRWPTGRVPVLSAEGTDVLVFIRHSAASTWMGFVVGQDIKAGA